MSDIVVNVTNAGAANIAVSNGSTVNATVGNGGAVNVTLGTVSPGNATVLAGTVVINSTTTLAAGANATVTNKGTAYAAVLDFGIPAGLAGQQGIQGPAGQNGTNGTNGVTPTLSVSATTLAAGSSATVTATPSNGGANVAIEFGIPRGDPGTGGGSNLTLSDGTPSALGTASAGTSNLASRADHVHQLPVISYANLSGVPSNFPSNIASVTGLQAALDGKQAAGNYLTSAVTSVNNLTGALTLAAGSNVTLTANGSTLTIASSGGASNWSSVANKPSIVNTLNGFGGTLWINAGNGITINEVPNDGGAYLVIDANGTSGGGSGSIVYAATVAGFPSTGNAANLYAATDTRRIYSWDASGVYVELGPGS